MKEDLVTRRILERTRELREEKERRTDKKPLNEGVSSAMQDLDGKKSFVIKKNDSKFADVRQTQESSIVKTVGEGVEFDENALVYYPENKDLVLTGKVGSLNLVFQFRYNDPSGDGCYIWASALQLTETNNRTLGKVRDAFLNWKNALIQDGDLMSMMQRESSENR